MAKWGTLPVQILVLIAHYLKSNKHDLVCFAEICRPFLGAAMAAWHKPLSMKYSFRAARYWDTVPTGRAIRDWGITRTELKGVPKIPRQGHLRYDLIQIVLAPRSRRRTPHNRIKDTYAVALVKQRLDGAIRRLNVTTANERRMQKYGDTFGRALDQLKKLHGVPQ